MKYYRFKVTTKGNEDIRIFDEISRNEQEFKNYNTYLEQYYFTNIEENEDYIAYKNDAEVIIILTEGQFEKNDLENVFEILFDSLYLDV